MTVEITLKQVAEEVMRLANKYPDFVYDSGVVTPATAEEPEVKGACRYHDPDNPSVIAAGTHEISGCIVGSALANLGVDVLNQIEEHEPAATTLKYLFPEQGGSLLIAMIDNVQAEQDQCKPWGEALQAAMMGVIG